VPFKTPGELGDQAGKNVWDIGNIGAEPQRAQTIDFTAAYCEIEATYMVPAGSPIKSITEVDRKGVKIVTSARSAYGLWLENNIKNAELIQVQGLDGAFNKFKDDKMDVLAGLRPGMLKDIEKMPGARILDGKFSAVQQAIGVAKGNPEAAAWLAAFVEEAKKSGLVASFIEKHKVKGLSVAPLA
jgi:polar amino acid transport system substrate-binding protein